MRKLYSLSGYFLCLVMTISWVFLSAQNAETIDYVNTLNNSVRKHLVSTPVLFSNNLDTSGALFYNGPFVTHPDSGVGGADESRFQSSLGLTYYGFGFQFTNGNRIADDFSSTKAWKIDSVVFFAYQTGSTTVSTIDSANILIWDASPALGGIRIFGDPSLNYLSDTSWSGIYRTLEAGGDVTRPVIKITCDLSDSNLILAPGTYWLDMQANGTLASGPWMPPISIWDQPVTGNAIQFTGAWADIVSGTYQQGVPFIVYGKIVSFHDLSIKSWLFPLDEIELTNSTPVTVLVENTGDSIINQFSMSYSIDSGLTFIPEEMVTHTLLPGESFVYSFATRADFSAYKKYHSVARVDYNRDMKNNNNTTSRSVYNYKRISAFPYEENFESNHEWYHEMVSGSDSWELGTPIGSNINTLPPAGGTKVWMTDLDASYPDNEESYVISPAFDLSKLQNAYVSMSINYASFDITSLQYSLDKGKSWKTLGATNSQGYNWYNTDNSEDDYWSGTLGEWRTAVHSLKGLTGKNNVMFRIWFKSNGINNSDGFAFDNFKIFEPVNDLSVKAWNYPTKGCGLSANDSITVTVRNTGTVAQDTFALYYSVDNGLNIQTEIVTTNLPEGGELVYTFNTRTDLSGGGNNICFAGVTLEEDELEFNNTIYFHLSKANSADYVSQDFETGDDINGWSVESQSNNRWTRNVGITPTNFTGPARSHGGSFYEYTPASNGFPQTVTSLYSPCLDLSGNDFGSLSFWSHMYGAETGELHIDVLNATGWVNDVFILKGEQQTNSDDKWQQNNILLTNDVSQVRIRAISGNGILSDMAIDDIIIQGIYTNDVGVVSIDPPIRELISLQPTSPKATIRNFGSVSQTFNISIKTENYYADTLTITLAPLESRQVTFNEFKPETGINQVMQVKTHLSNDSVPTNDSIMLTIEADTLTQVYGYVAANHISGYKGPVTFYLERPDVLFPISDNQSGQQFVAAGSWAEGNWVGAEYYGNWVSFDTLTGERDVIMDLDVDYMGLAYDWTTNKMFGITQFGQLYSVSLTTGQAEYIGTPTLPGAILINLACDSAGQLFSLDIINDTLYQLDKNTAQATGLFHVGFNSSFAQDMEYDHSNNIMYMAAYGSGTQGELRYVDFDNDTTVLLGAFENGAEITSLAIPYRMSGQTKIVGFSVPGQLQPAVIDQVNHTVEVLVDKITDRASLVADFILSEKAKATVTGVDQVSGVTANNFNNPVIYILTNGGNTQNWTVSVKQKLAHFLRYSIPEEVEQAIINDTTHTVEVVVAPGTELDSLIATFIVSQGAIAKVGDSIQVSGTTANNFTMWVNYWVINGNDSLEWIVKVTNDDLRGTDIFTFSFAQQTGPAIINKDHHTINIECSSGSNLSSLIATFTLSNGAIALVGPNLQTSGVSVNNFSAPVIYSVFSGMGDVQDWIVTTTRALYTGNDILSFTVNNQVGNEVIDNIKKTVKIEIGPGTDISNYKPASVTISPGATITPSITKRQDFSSGPVTYVVTSENGVSKTWKVTIGENVKIESINHLSDISVYPVPASGFLNIDAKDAIITQIRIIDIMGKVVLINGTKTLNSVLSLNISSLHAGIYLLEIKTTIGILQKRVQVMK